MGQWQLKAGQVVCNAMGLPLPCSGNFADVYALQSPRQKWAVKCFTREIPGIRERYVEVSKYLAQQNLPFMVEFKFLDQGIRVRGQWYPVLKMHWVEGFALNQFVRQQAGNPAVLQTLGQMWVKMAIRLREANLAHCDLQHGNVLLIPNLKGSLSVRLVDYDGMCVPALELLKSIEVGHPNFQHPQRLKEGTYNIDVDRFAHLVIYTALRALTVGGPGLWQKFDNGDNLLFKQADLANPSQSAVFRELQGMKDGEVRKLVDALAQAAARPISQVPLLESLVGTPPKTTVSPGGPSKPTTNVFADAAAGGSRRKTKARSKSLGLLWAGLAVVLLAVAGGVAFLVSQQGEDKPTTAVIASATQKTLPETTAKPTPPLETRPVVPPTVPKVETKVEPKVQSKTEVKTEPIVQVTSEQKVDLPPTASYVFAKMKSTQGIVQSNGKWSIRGGKLEGTFRSLCWFEPVIKTPFWAKFEVNVAQGNNVDILLGPADPAYGAGSKLLCLIQDDAQLGIKIAYGRDLTPFVPIPEGKRILEARVFENEVIALVDGKECLRYKYENGVRVPARVGLGSWKGKYEIESVSFGPIGSTAIKSSTNDPGQGPEKFQSFFLSSLPETNFQSPDPLGKNGVLYDGRTPIVVGGKPSPKGMCTFPHRNGMSRLTYSLGNQYQSIKGAAGLNDTSPGTKVPLTFQILGDGKLLWTSKGIQKSGQSETFDVAIVGVNQLELQVLCPGDPLHAHAVWIEPELLKQPADDPPITTQVNPASTNRQPIPDASALASADKAIKQLYAADYAKRLAADRRALAQKLLQQAASTKDDPAARFVCYREAGDVAAGIPAPVLAMHAVDAMAAEFLVDALALKEDALLLASRAPSTPASNKALYEAATAVMEQAIAQDDYDRVITLAKIAQSGAFRGKMPETAAAAARIRDAEALKRDFVAVQAAMKTLAANPDDPAANLVVGKHQFLTRGDAEQGLPLLAKGSDATLKALAVKDLAGAKDAKGQMDIGDGWHDLAESETGMAKKSLQQRAGHWYQQALPGLMGLEQAKVRQRCWGYRHLELLHEVQAKNKPTIAIVNTASNMYLAHGNFDCLASQTSGPNAKYIAGPGLADANLISFEAVSQPAHFLRHHKYQMGLQGNVNDALFRLNATFRIVKALSDNPGISLESVNYPGLYIRQREGRYFIEKNDGSLAFRNDATFLFIDP